LYTNYFELISRPNWVLYQYHVDFEPEQGSKKLKYGLLKQHDDLFGQNKAFDGQTIFSLVKLDQEVTKFKKLQKNFKKN
jgi:aubergine